jgi:eukaryotic-like serine/threonine-protein kinase
MPSPVRPGDIIKGKYRVDRMLGEGGMGVVVAAHHLALDQRVAIKLLQPALLAVLAVVERFAREARAASKIESDHVARVTDVDALDDGTPFMVMEYLDGHDLSIVRERGLGVPIPTAVGYVLEACEAIGEAHRRGIVHRDIKPANLFVSKKSDGRSRVKVLDFGISKIGVGEATSPKVTSTGAVMGSAEYMSPEQMLSTRDVDARTDIWALGVTLYELLTGRVPFSGETVTQIYTIVMTTTPTPPSALRADVPPGLDAVILRCLARDREARYGSIAELTAALAPYGAGAGQPVSRGSMASFVNAQTVPWSSSAGPAPQTGATFEVQSRPAGPAGARKTAARSFAIGAGVVTALGIGVAVVSFSSFNGSGSTSQALAPSARPAATTPVDPTVTRPASPPTPEVVVTMGETPKPPAQPASSATAAPSTAGVASPPEVHPSARSKPAAGPKPTSAPTSTAAANPTTKPQPLPHTMD